MAQLFISIDFHGMKMKNVPFIIFIGNQYKSKNRPPCEDEEKWLEIRVAELPAKGRWITGGVYNVLTGRPAAKEMTLEQVSCNYLPKGHFCSFLISNIRG